jgi:uncharacterized membrane protein
VEWTGARYADRPTVEASTWIDAPVARVWSFVADLSVMPRLSGELQAVEWLDGEKEPGVGARFLGSNKHPSLGEWTTTSIVIEYEAQRVFTWAVGNPDEPAALWRYTAEHGARGGTKLSQWMQLGPGRSGLSYAIDAMPDKEEKIVFVRLREFEKAMEHGLATIKALAEHV